MIPKIVHMVFGLSDDFGNKPFHLIHNIAIKSAHNIIKPDKIFLYCKYEPENNKYWNEIKSIVEIVKVEPVSEIFGNQIEHCAHKTDILRLEKLIEIGGIYLDCDTICINSFDNLLNNNFVMGKRRRILNLEDYGMIITRRLIKQNGMNIVWCYQKN